jgi:hypothetical protein
VSPVINPSGGGGGAGSISVVSDSLLAAPAASFDIQNIPAIFTHLLMTGMLRGDVAGNRATSAIRFNNDSGANYGEQHLDLNGTTVTGVNLTAQTSAAFSPMAAASSIANRFGTFDAFFPDYQAGTAHFRSFEYGGGVLGTAVAADREFQRGHGTWDNTAAITRITVLPPSGNFIAGSRVTLYGLT